MFLDSENQDDERLVIDLNAKPATPNTDIEEPTDGVSNSNNSFSTSPIPIEQDDHGHAKRKRKMWRPTNLDRDYVERLIQKVRHFLGIT